MIKTSDGRQIDLRNIRSPIVVFCSKGDNVTPPQQALGWIRDLYENADQIRSFGQTIVYTVHESIGHLGIFVSAGVAKKEHGEFSSNIDLIDTLPPGLYEAIFEEKSDGTSGGDLVTGKWVMRCEARTLDDIAAMGGNDAEDDRRFAAAARLSEVNLNLYRTLVQPTVRALANPAAAEWMQKMHPLRLSYEMFSDANPFMRMVAGMAENVRKDRKPASEDNPFLAMQEQISDQIVESLEAFRELSEKTAERTFLTLFGQPALQAALGIDPAGAHSACKATDNPLHQQLIEQRIGELKARIPEGGMREAVIRGTSLRWNVARLDGRARVRDGTPPARSARRDIAC